MTFDVAIADWFCYCCFVSLFFFGGVCSVALHLVSLIFSSYFLESLHQNSLNQEPYSIRSESCLVNRMIFQLVTGLSWTWTTILISLDNSGMWNLRTDNLNSWYLGQEMYISVVNSEDDKSEVSLPENAIFCGVLLSLQK